MYDQPQDFVGPVKNFNELQAGTANASSVKDVTRNSPLNITDDWLVFTSAYGLKKIQIASSYSTPGLTLTRLCSLGNWSNWVPTHSGWYCGS